LAEFASFSSGLTHRFPQFDSKILGIDADLRAGVDASGEFDIFFDDYRS
jgi:hypothetical protein